MLARCIKPHNLDQPKSAERAPGPRDDSSLREFVSTEDPPVHSGYGRRGVKGIYGRFYFTFSMSGSFHVLRKSGSSGP